MNNWVNNATNPASTEFSEFINRFTKAKYVFLFLGLLVTSDAAGEQPLWVLTLSGAVVFAGLGFFSVWNYEKHRQSARALFFMMDGTMSSIALLLLFGIEEAARVHARNYWLYENYYYFYCVALITIFLYFLLRKSGLVELKEQMATLLAYAEKGTISSSEFYEIMTRQKGAREVIRNWNSRRFALILGPISVAFVGVGVLGGRDYILYTCFLGAVLISPFLIALVLRRRIQMYRYLGHRDVTIRY